MHNCLSNSKLGRAGMRTDILSDVNNSNACIMHKNNAKEICIVFRLVLPVHYQSIQCWRS